MTNLIGKDEHSYHNGWILKFVIFFLNIEKDWDKRDTLKYHNSFIKNIYAKNICHVKIQSCVENFLVITLL